MTNEVISRAAELFELAYEKQNYNLGRIYLAKEMYTKARGYFERSIEISPEYDLAREALEKLKRSIQ